MRRTKTEIKNEKIDIAEHNNALLKKLSHYRRCPDCQSVYNTRM